MRICAICKMLPGELWFLILSYIDNKYKTVQTLSLTSHDVADSVISYGPNRACLLTKKRNIFGYPSSAYIDNDTMYADTQPQPGHIIYLKTHKTIAQLSSEYTALSTLRLGGVRIFEIDPSLWFNITELHVSSCGPDVADYTAALRNVRKLRIKKTRYSSAIIATKQQLQELEWFEHPNCFDPLVLHSMQMLQKLHIGLLGNEIYEISINDILSWVPLLREATFERMMVTNGDNIAQLKKLKLMTCTYADNNDEDSFMKAVRNIPHFATNRLRFIPREKNNKCAFLMQRKKYSDILNGINDDDNDDTKYPAITKLILCNFTRVKVEASMFPNLEHIYFNWCRGPITMMLRDFSNIKSLHIDEKYEL